MSEEYQLSDLEEELYNLLIKKGVLTYPEIQEINPRMTGAVGKLISKKYAKVIRDRDEPEKSERKKIYPMSPNAVETKEEPVIEEEEKESGL